MNKKRFAVCVAAVLMFVCIGTLQESRSVRESQMPQRVIEQIPLPQPLAEESAQPANAAAREEEEALPGGGYYVLKDYMGKLAVYRVYHDGTRVIASILDTDIYQLPARDVESLQEGIVLRSEEALTRILEDFMS
ncbi:MAG: BofC C-terminal domain-containing protein [Clostridia bacterium]|nr:BofC C-terminal domain-containing protein [Clostridia bacterium]